MKQLKIDHLTKSFGGIVAIEDVDLTINQGEKVGLIGPNGAGKTTLFNCMTGVYVPTSGEISLLDDEDKITLSKLSMDKITDNGFARTFQNIRLFHSMSVLDNVKVAINHNLDYNLLDTIFKTNQYFKEEYETHGKAIEYLELTNLAEKRFEKAANLSYGEQRRLEIARALATGARFIFIDEPAAGMNSQETKDLIQFIHEIHEQFDLTIILIEHDMNLVMNVCERIYVLNYGRLIAEGTPDEIRQNPDVIDAYLGKEEDADVKN